MATTSLDPSTDQAPASRQFAEDLRRVWSHLGWRFGVLVALSLLEAALEGLGILLFIPLLEHTGFAPGGERQSSIGGSGAVRAMNALTDGLGLGGVLLTIAGVFALKGVVLFLTVSYRNLTLQDHGFALRRQFLALVRGADYTMLMGHGPRIAHELAAELQQSLNAIRAYSVAFGNLLKVALLAVAAFLLAPQIGLFFLTLAITSTWIVRAIIQRVQEASREASRRSANYSVRVNEAIRAMKFLRATGRFEAMEEQVTADARASRAIGRRLSITGALQRALQEPLVVAMMCGILFVAYRVFALDLSLLLAASLFLYRCIMELDRFQMQWQHYAQVRGSLDVLEERRAMLEASQLSRNAVDQALSFASVFGGGAPRLELREVRYGYRRDAAAGSGIAGVGGASQSDEGDANRDSIVLDELDLVIDSGEFLAIVGESGAGKTTVLDVLAGLLRPTRGDYTVNGVEVEPTNLAALRQRLGYVTQFPNLFNGSISENLLLGAALSKDPSAQDARIQRALGQAHCGALVQSLPEGLETVVGERGRSLSGGQVQLLAIARELVRDPRVLMLDEPTSALDAESEDRIQQTLEELRGSMTLVVVSHRLATVRKADRIAFVEGGRIIEHGSFAELRAREGSRFGRFCELQGVL